MNEVESEKVDYQEKDLTNEIKRKAIFFIKYILGISLVMLIFTLLWSLF